jgi:hypothetical protein
VDEGKRQIGIASNDALALPYGEPLSGGGGGLFHRGLREIVRGRFWERSVYVYWAPRGEPGGGGLPSWGL